MSNVSKLVTLSLILTLSLSNELPYFRAQLSYSTSNSLMHLTPTHVNTLLLPTSMLGGGEILYIIREKHLPAKNR